MLNVMELLRPIVGIPEGLVSSGARGEYNIQQGNVELFDAESRAFRMLRGVDTEEQGIKTYGGNYSPQAYLETLDFIINEIGKQSGFGHRALTCKVIKHNKLSVTLVES